MNRLIDVPPGLKGVAVADTAIGTVDGEVGRFRYRNRDAVDVARGHTFEEAWHLLERGHLPDRAQLERFGRHRADQRVVPRSLDTVLEAVAGSDANPLGRLQAVLGVSASPLGLSPLLDLAPDERAAQARRLASVIPGILARLHRRTVGLPPVPDDPSLGHVAAYLRGISGAVPAEREVRALEQYLILTMDHGFNASTFTARVVASTGADPVAIENAAIGALSGPLHGGAPSRALDAVDAIGSPDRAADWVRSEVATGRRIMGFGHAVYRSVDPRSRLLRELAIELGGPLVERAVAIEREILTTLAELKPDRPLPSNVEFYAGVIMESIGLPRAMFTPTFVVSRTIGWMAHAVEQANEGTLIRPSARFVEPPGDRGAMPQDVLR